MRWLTGFMCLLVLNIVGCGESRSVCSGTVCPCTQEGIQAAIAAGGGPFTFDCDGPTTLVTDAEIVIDNEVILDGEGNLTVDANESHRVFSVPEGKTVELRGFGITRGNAFLGGGVLEKGGTLTLTGCTLQENTVDEGGAIRSAGTLTINNSLVSANSADSRGGGIFNFDGTMILMNSTVSGNTSMFLGGGIANDGTVTLTNSTVSGNTAAIGGGISNAELTMTLTNTTVSRNTAGSGGGIHSAAPLSLTNSTVSENRADTGHAGGIFNYDGTLTLTSSTVSGNTAAEGAAGIRIAGSATLTNTLVANGCDGSATSGGGNIESPNDTCGLDQATDQVNVSADDLKLDQLAGNGGPTQTHALGAGSVAIDVIQEAECLGAQSEPLTTDQRGEPRPAGRTDPKICDVGAFEVQP